MITAARAAWRDLRRGAIARAAGACQCAGDCGGHVGPCGASLAAGVHVDHILPRRPADPRVPAGPDVPANLRGLCPNCNRRKSNRLTTLPEGELRRSLLRSIVVQVRLARAGVPTALRAPIIAPHVATLRLQPAPGHAHVTEAVAAEVRAAVHAPTARVYAHGAELRVEVPRARRRPVPLADMPRRALRFGVGLDTENRVAHVDLDAAPHVLVAGASGSGKSEILRVVAWHLAAAGAELVLVDPDGETWAPLERAAALAVAVAADTDAGVRAIHHARALMDARPVDTSCQRPLVLMVDEVHMLGADVLDALVDIAKRGRKRRVFVVVATHRPTRDALPRVLTDQLAWAIAGRVKDAAGSKVIVDASGAQHLGGRGDMLLAHGGRVVRIQAALAGAADWRRLPLATTPPPPAPEIDEGESGDAADPRHVRKPVDTAAAWLIDRWNATGVSPSAKAAKARFGGSTTRAMRARDAALAALGQAAPQY